MTNPARYLDAMRKRAPLVQNITNFVAMSVSANVLLAAGAAPAMVHDAHEAPEFAALADALVINIGTLSADWLEAMEAATRAADRHAIPWVLDPVAAGGTAFRRAAAGRLIDRRPTIIRGNASEIIALGDNAATGRGVDATDSVAAAEAAARLLATHSGAIIAVTGARDFVTDGQRAAGVTGGHPLMTRVSGLGCALSALTAAFAASANDRFEATLAALAYYGLAGERAAQNAAGPGSFAITFLDALAAIQPTDLASDRIVPA